MKVFEDNFSELLTSLNESMMSIPSLAHDRSFHPFTQPILYGKIEYFDRSGNPEETHFVDGHQRECDNVLVRRLRIVSYFFVLWMLLQVLKYYFGKMIIVYFQVPLLNNVLVSSYCPTKVDLFSKIFYF